MSVSDNVNPIVVAVDGSESALRAVRWAADEAVRRGRRLRIVHVYDWPLPAYGPVFVDPSTMHDVVLARAGEVLSAAAAIAVATAPEARCETEALRGAAVAVLREVSRGAALLVLGSRGRGGFTGLLTGSVAVALAAYGCCPVVVVRGAVPESASALDREITAGAEIVVGVDGSRASEEAIAIAFDEAAMRGCGLVAVHAWTDGVLPVLVADFVPDVDWRRRADEVAEVLGERLAGWQGKYPEVPVRRVIERERPAKALLDAAENAQLLVVGSRGRGGFAGLTLGSISQAMIHHSPCPVLIARP